VDKQILIVGDFMLDEYVDVEVTRISPEAPIPVMRRLGSRVVPGGAGNVATNVMSLGGENITVRLVAAWNPGDCGVIDPEPSTKIYDRATTRKTRFVTKSGHQVARLDTEDSRPLDSCCVDHLRSAALAALDADIGAVIISDYAKGVCTAEVLRPLIIEARRRNYPVIVDPKHPHWARYSGATVITPNEAEFKACLKGDDHTVDHVLITRGEHGMTLISDDGITHLASIAEQVYDVTGAGDTVVAALAVRLAAGDTMLQAAYYANIAAGVVVGKRGTATVTPAEVHSHETWGRIG
jgi:D-beta-D-heptose 7-phosphate kinase / D-beta-D-heptose 1-phosphate adenosyltransferase